MDRKKLNSSVGKTDTQDQTTNGTQERYSDEDLSMFRELISEKLKTAEVEYKNLKSNLIKSDDPEDGGEEGRSSLSKEENMALAQRQEKYILCLKNSIVRIEQKTYGICRETGKLIPKERLLLVPHATMCVEAKKNRDK